MITTDTAAPTLAGIPMGDLAKHCQDPTMLATVVSLAYNQGYKLGQEHVHRYYRMLGGELVNDIPGISQEWEDKGYWSGRDENDESVVLVGYKGKVLGAYRRWDMTQESLDAVCERDYAKLPTKMAEMMR